MTAVDLVRVVTSAVFLLAFLSTALSAARSRRRESIDAALFFGAIAIVILRIELFPGEAPPLITTVVVALVLALPYLLLRLLDDFAGASRRVMRVALAGVVVLVPGAFLVGSPLPTWFIVPAFVYAGVLAAYAAWAFIQEARRSSGVTQRRMQFAALGSLFLGLTVLMPAFGQLVDTDVALRVLALCSALGYYFAFTPPAFVRRAWQAPGLRSFLERASAISPAQDTAAIIERLEAEVTVVTGALDAAIGLWDEGANGLRLRSGALRPVTEGLDGRAFREQHSVISTNITRDDPASAERYRERGIRAVVAAPMSVPDGPLGTLAAYSRRGALFAEDDLAFIQLLAHQAALVLEAARRYAELSTTNVRLAEATRVKSEFLANMSHELRTPLNAIMGFSDLLSEQLKEQLSAVQMRYLRNIRTAGDHLLGLINDVLDIAKVEAGRLELRPEVVHLSTLLEPVVASTRTAADAAGVQFDVDSPDDDALRVDPARLRQVLYNLLSNAVKFTPRGGSMRLRVAFDGADLVIEVVDTGIGIPLSQRHRVFGTFARLHEGRSDAPGTGLGLALTKSLVELHHGTIAFESEEGRGTTFRVVLPEARVEATNGDRVLVVEDVQADADLIVALAQEAGLATEIVGTVQAAIDSVRAHRPRGVVLDLRLPDERGERFLETLKADPDTRAIPVIVVTVEDDEGRSRPLGADDHLTKPIDRQRLAAWFRRVKQA